MATLQLYVKNTSNCAGMDLQTFETLGPTWEGERLRMWFGTGEWHEIWPNEAERRELEVVGWTDLFFGSPSPVRVAKVQHAGDVGYLVHGGNSGVRILDEWLESTPLADVSHLPRGYGRPVVWVEDADDLPPEVVTYCA